MPIEHQVRTAVSVQPRAESRERDARGDCARCGVTAVLEMEHCHRCRRIIGVQWTEGPAGAPDPASRNLLSWFALVNLGLALLTAGLCLLLGAGTGPLGTPGAYLVWGAVHALAVFGARRGDARGWTVWVASSFLLLFNAPFGALGPLGGITGLLNLAVLLWPSVRQEFRDPRTLDVPGWTAAGIGAIVAFDALVALRLNLLYMMPDRLDWVPAAASVLLAVRIASLAALRSGERGFVPALAMSWLQVGLGAVVAGQTYWHDGAGFACGVALAGAASALFLEAHSLARRSSGPGRPDALSVWTYAGAAVEAIAFAFCCVPGRGGERTALESVCAVVLGLRLWCTLAAGQGHGGAWVVTLGGSVLDLLVITLGRGLEGASPMGVTLALAVAVTRVAVLWSVGTRNWCRVSSGASAKRSRTAVHASRA